MYVDNLYFGKQEVSNKRCMDGQNQNQIYLTSIFFFCELTNTGTFLLSLFMIVLNPSILGHYIDLTFKWMEIMEVLYCL